VIASMSALEARLALFLFGSESFLLAHIWTKGSTMCPGNLFAATPIGGVSEFARTGGITTVAELPSLSYFGCLLYCKEARIGNRTIIVSHEPNV
jgi:hypothetical protein